MPGQELQPPGLDGSSAGSTKLGKDEGLPSEQLKAHQGSEDSGTVHSPNLELAPGA